MDTIFKLKETKDMIYGNPFYVQPSSNSVKMSSNENFNNIPVHLNELVNANSIDLNGAASLSDDSGIPLTTNSSISSGDSYRLGMCKFENESAESDGEASQFDSLDNCSEGGMSGENFNTLKKGPLAPIDPPPEFQDSPESTIRHTYSQNSLRRWTSSQSSFEHLKDRVAQEMSNIKKNCLIPDTTNFKEIDKNMKELFTTNKHLYSSDSILNSHTDNIYDEPNNIISSSLGNSVDGVDLDVSTSCPPPLSSRTKEDTCPHFEDHNRYFKAIPSAQDNMTKKVRNSDVGFEFYNHTPLHNYTRVRYAQQENCAQRKFLPSPLCHSFYCHHYQGGNGCNHRPNSRNSLNSRLSISHNSLSVSSNNKPDDSIFITQAMSHDALLSREISDFYNVPIDSDIYAFPIDMIRSEKSLFKKITIKKKRNSLKSDTLRSDILGAEEKLMTKQKRKKKQMIELRNEYNVDFENTNNENIAVKKSSNAHVISTNTSFVSNNPSLEEPFHMTLEEVKQFYQTIYAGKSVFPAQGNKDINLSNETIWRTAQLKDKNVAYSIKTSRTMPKFNSKVNSTNLNENINNNNIDSLISSTIANGRDQNTEEISVNSNHNFEYNKPIISNEKRSQFSLNLKQKFCSLFRFRRSQNRLQSICATQNQVKENLNCINSRTSEDKKKKFQSRALPPLPKKIIDQSCSSFDADKKRILDMKRPFRFTSSIEKVKDYGWYWGPLSSEAAEKVLSNEPDGSFIVRDSSDDHYIFSLSFKLNNCVRHVRIEQDQGTFSFGSYAKFKSQTITEFIEKAVDHSRSGRYLFFLHRRPEHGPMRVQLTNPVSRFKHVQSLQHMCRFVILKAVIRKDLIQTLPLPRRLLDYLNYKHFYSEQVESDCSHSQTSDDGRF